MLFLLITYTSEMNLIFTYDWFSFQITGNSQQQWRLLLEEKKSNFYWPFCAEGELNTYSEGKGVPVADKAALGGLNNLKKYF